MTEPLEILFAILIFPGFLFTVVLGLVASWIVRKVSALVQWRVGPPIYQPFVDVVKLMGKEILVPEAGHRNVFMAAPIIGMEAETELGRGVLMEYSGALLAVWKIMQAMMLVALPMFLVMVFLGGFTGGLLTGIGKYVLVLVLIILIKNTNPRVRIDQAMKFFWVYCGLLLVGAVVLATIGNNYAIGWL